MFHDDPRAPPMWSPWRPRPQGWDTYVKQLRNGAERLDVLAKLERGDLSPEDALDLLKESR